MAGHQLIGAITRHRLCLAIVIDRAGNTLNI